MNMLTLYSFKNNGYILGIGSACFVDVDQLLGVFVLGQELIFDVLTSFVKITLPFALDKTADDVMM